MNVTRREFLGVSALSVAALTLPAAIPPVLLPEPVPLDLQPAPAPQNSVYCPNVCCHLHVIPTTTTYRAGDYGSRLQLLARGFKLTVPDKSLLTHQLTPYQVDFDEIVAPSAVMQEFIATFSNLRHESMLYVQAMKVEHLELNYALFYRPMLCCVGLNMLSAGMHIMQSVQLQDRKQPNMGWQAPTAITRIYEVGNPATP